MVDTIQPKGNKPRSLPVRVVSTPTPPIEQGYVAAPSTQSAMVRSPRASSAPADRRSVMIVAIGIIMLGVVGLWIATVGSSLVEPGEPDNLFQSIRDAFKR